jgi:uncharacterized OsmC-like protein
MPDSVTEKTQAVNGLDVAALSCVVMQVQTDPGKGIVQFRVHTEWKGRTLSETSIDSYTIGGQTVPRRFRVPIDEPNELLGANSAPNPQEMLMAALNACMTVGYVACAAAKGITLDSLAIETSGELDLRGFLGIDPKVRPGYEAIKYTVRLKGKGSEAQFREIHETVLRTSPNYFNLTRPIRLDATLMIDAQVDPPR